MPCPVAIIALLVSAVALARADWCDNSYMINGTTSPSSQLTVSQINAILKAHNDARRSVSPWATLMPMLQWDQAIANNAYSYMAPCPGMVHSSSASRSNVAGPG